jgi:hypothetical protein
MVYICAIHCGLGFDPPTPTPTRLRDLHTRMFLRRNWLFPSYHVGSKQFYATSERASQPFLSPQSLACPEEGSSVGRRRPMRNNQKNSTIGCRPALATRQCQKTIITHFLDPAYANKIVGHLVVAKNGGDLAASWFFFLFD